MLKDNPLYERIIQYMDKLDYAILHLMVERKANIKISAITRKVILEEFTIKSDTLYRRLSRLVKLGYLKNGIQEGRDFTYYITEQGEQLLMEVINEK